MDTTGPATDWGAETVPTVAVPAPILAPAASQPSQTVPGAPTGFGDQDWNVEPTGTTKNWADEGDWVGTGTGEPVSQVRQELCVYLTLHAHKGKKNYFFYLQVSGGNW